MSESNKAEVLGWLHYLLILAVWIGLSMVNPGFFVAFPLALGIFSVFQEEELNRD